jgi:hypothetical protein
LRLPPSTPPISLNHGLQVHRLITASKCITNLVLSRPPSASPNLLNDGLQVHLQAGSITASMCISTLARSLLPSVSPNLLNYSVQVRTITDCNFARLQPSSASPPRLITASEHISMFTGSQCGELAELEGKTAQHKHSTAPRMASGWNS